MQNNRTRIVKVVWSISAIVFALIVAGGVWLYSGALTAGKIKVFQTLPLPMAVVNLQPLSMKDFLTRFAVAQTALGPGGAQDARPGIVAELVKETEISQLAAWRDVTVSQKQVDDQYGVLAARTNLQGQPNFEKFLQIQGLDAKQFKNNIIRPELLYSQLEIWFNSRADLNPEAYRLANNLLSQINSGGSMGVLASEYSQDPIGKNSQGDIGFVQITDLSPELREGVSTLKPGEAKIIPGQNGLFIIRLESQTGNLLHLRQIFLNTNDFNVWLDSQFKNFIVINLLKI